LEEECQHAETTDISGFITKNPHYPHVDKGKKAISPNAPTKGI